MMMAKNTKIIISALLFILVCVAASVFVVRYYQDRDDKQLAQQLVELLRGGKNDLAINVASKIRDVNRVYEMNGEPYLLIDLAIASRELSVIKSLLDKGANLCCHTKGVLLDKPPTILAAIVNHYDDKHLMELLLQYKFDVNCRYSPRTTGVNGAGKDFDKIYNGATPLYASVDCDNIWLFREILKRNPDCSITYNNDFLCGGDILLFSAGKFVLLQDDIKKMISLGAKIEGTMRGACAKEMDHFTPLCIAAYSSIPDNVNILALLGANVNIKITNSFFEGASLPMISLSSRYPSLECLKLLKKHGVNMSLKDDKGRDILYYAQRINASTDKQLSNKESIINWCESALK